MVLNFSNTARFILGLIVAACGYLVGGEMVHVDEQTRGALALGIVLLGSAGIVPPIKIPWEMTPAQAWLLTSAVSIGAYVIQTVGSIDPTVRGLAMIALALAGSLGIKPIAATIGNKPAGPPA